MEEHTETMPAYHVSAWQVGALHANYSAPQCSAAGGVLLLLRVPGRRGPVPGHEGAGEAADLAGQGAPGGGANGAAAVQRDGAARRVLQASDHGADAGEPGVVLNSIQKHLLFSGEFHKAFTKVVDNQFTSVIMHLNEQMIDAKTRRVVESTRKAWVDTIKAFKLWKDTTK